MSRRPTVLLNLQLALLLAPLLLAGCLDIPGLEPGDPCNANEICAEGLICEDAICVDNSTISWEAMSRPFTTTLHDVWGASATNVFAVGVNGTVLRYQGDGLNWVDANQQTSGGMKSTLQAVWGSGPTSVWAVGSSGIVHYDGTTWTKQEAFNELNELIGSYTLYDVHGDGGELYAVGSVSYSDPLVLRYEWGNQRWKKVTAASLSFAGRGVFVRGKKVWIVGTASHVLHFDGSTWKQQNLPSSTSDLALNAIWGFDGDNLVAVGPPSTLARLDSTGWKTDAKARGSGTAYRVWGTSAADLFVVGASSGGYTDQSSGIEHCGSSCSKNPVPDKLRSTTLRGVWGTADGKVVYAVGDTATILRRSR